MLAPRFSALVGGGGPDMSKSDSRLHPLPGDRSVNRGAANPEGREKTHEIRPEGIASRIARPADKSLAADAIVVWQHLKILTQGLRIAFRDLEKQRDAHTMRHRYIAALMRIADFVKGTGMGGHIAVSMSELAMALSELDLGIVYPVLRPQKRSNRPPDPGLIWIERARLVCAYELLRASGLTSRAAFKRIREYGNAFDILLERSEHRGRAALENSLPSWRKAFKAGKVQSPVAQARYKRLMEIVEDLPGASWKAAKQPWRT